VAMRERAELLGGIVEFVRPAQGATERNGGSIESSKEKVDSHAG